jgi:hypothetical protein
LGWLHALQVGGGNRASEYVVRVPPSAESADTPSANYTDTPSAKSAGGASARFTDTPSAESASAIRLKNNTDQSHIISNTPAAGGAAAAAGSSGELQDAEDVTRAIQRSEAADREMKAGDVNADVRLAILAEQPRLTPEVVRKLRARVGSGARSRGAVLAKLIRTEGRDLTAEQLAREETERHQAEAAAAEAETREARSREEIDATIEGMSDADLDTMRDYVVVVKGDAAELPRDREALRTHAAFRAHVANATRYSLGFAAAVVAARMRISEVMAKRPGSNGAA